MMKRFFIISMSLLVLISFLGAGLRASDGKDAMSSFMGAKWGVSFKVFEETFKYKDKMEVDGSTCTLSSFKLGDIKVTIRFEFFTKGFMPMNVTDENSHKLLLREAVIIMQSNQYDSLLAILTAKYGKPDSSSKLVSRWKNKELNRRIQLTRYDYPVKYGTAWFAPINASQW